MLSTNLTKYRLWLLPALAFGLAGCGLTQSVTEGTKSAFNSVFYKTITTLHLDFTAREALNIDTRENNSLSVPVVVRIYQLKNRKVFDKITYQQLLTEGDSLLKEDVLASREVVLRPGGDASLDMPMESEAKFVAVVGLFRNPDIDKEGWKQVLEREELDPDRPRVLQAGNNVLTLLPPGAK
ncbi:type VI secretion system lipoprotein TssJ [Intestinirhabdus alba]|uniref:Type VI secretion system lipoprotein TssJ n=1 Tax=Intestinirhabdus alba TaxID=2899544 RepID=A0A6L6IS53_9ENTR|nr:type VI secretion system lipoprotein TssJ [Intestinirhabdus alba]